MATLNERHKAAIVVRLACFETPSQVRRALEREFRITPSLQQICFYDPTNQNGAQGLGQQWRQLFAETRKRFVEEVQALPIAERAARIQRLNDHWLRMRDLVEARSEDHADAPGGDTGLLVRDVKVIGKGEDAREVEVFKFDAALLRELRETEEQAAKELGQWTERSEVTVLQKLAKEVDGMSDAELLALVAGDSDPAEAGGGGGTA
jgi:hypothetical protein